VLDNVFGHGACLPGGEMKDRDRRPSCAQVVIFVFRLQRSVVSHRRWSMGDRGAISVNIFDSKDSIRHSVIHSVIPSFSHSFSPSVRQDLSFSPSIHLSVSPEKNAKPPKMTHASVRSKISQTPMAFCDASSMPHLSA
jgi:hypothetical protein